MSTFTPKKKIKKKTEPATGLFSLRQIVLTKNGQQFRFFWSNGRAASNCALSSPHAVLSAVEKSTITTLVLPAPKSLTTNEFNVLASVLLRLNTSLNEVNCLHGVTINLSAQCAIVNIQYKRHSYTYSK